MATAYGREARPEIEVYLDEDKRYLCITQGNFEGGKIEIYLNRQEASDVADWIRSILDNWI